MGYALGYNDIPFTVLKLDETDYNKIIAMITRGKSDTFIARYIGVPVAKIEKVRNSPKYQSRINPKYAKQDDPRGYINRLAETDPPWTDEQVEGEETRRERQARRRNRRFLKAMKNAGVKIIR